MMNIFYSGSIPAKLELLPLSLATFFCCKVEVIGVELATMATVYRLTRIPLCFCWSPKPEELSCGLAIGMPF